MLYIVLLLALVALGLLITALVTAHTLWAWISIGVSVFALVLLMIDLLRHRRARAEAEEAAEQEEQERAQAGLAGAGLGDDEVTGTHDTLSDDTELLAPVDDDTPAEEATDAADLLIVSELDIEVRVVDEFPRYHLTNCRWLTSRSTIPIAVAEARELGFTPCARCAPDSTIAAHHRNQQSSQSTS